MIGNIIVECQKCHHKTGLLPATEIVIDDIGIRVKHSEHFHTQYNGAHFKTEGSENIVMIPSCIFCK